jgi:hypothetical protein
MKAFLILAALVVSTSAFAMPKVGDKALYEGTMKHNGQDMAFTMESVLTAYDAAANRYNQTNTMQMQGETHAESGWVDAVNLLTDAQIDQVLAECAKFGGVSEEVAVKAGRYQTCRLANGDGTVSLGKVAFGIVKIDMPTMKAELVSSSMGQ